MDVIVMDCKAIIDSTQNFVREYWFENLNLRGAYKKDILEIVKEKIKDNNTLLVES